MTHKDKPAGNSSYCAAALSSVYACLGITKLHIRYARRRCLCMYVCMYSMYVVRQLKASAGESPILYWSPVVRLGTLNMLLDRLAAADGC